MTQQDPQEGEIVSEDETPEGVDAPGASESVPEDEAAVAVEVTEAELAKWKKRHKASERQLRDLRKQVKELVDPAEVATVEAQLTDATGSLRQAEAEALKYKVALEVGLPMDLAIRLQGADRDEMIADAENLKQLMKPKKAGAGNAAAVSGPQNEAAKPQDLNALMRAAVAKS